MKASELIKAAPQNKEEYEQWRNNLPEEEKQALLEIEKLLANKIQEIGARLTPVVNKIQKIGTRLTPAIKLFEENREILDEMNEKIDELPDLLSMSEEEFNNTPFWKIVELYKALGEEDVELLNSILPENYIIPNNKLSNKMVKEALEHKNLELIVSNKKRKDVITKVSLNYDDENIKIYDKERRFTPEDRTVYNSICTLYEAGNTAFTPDQVYRTANGLDDSQYVSLQARERIIRSIDNTRRIYACIDYTEEAKAYRKEIENCNMDDYILSARKITLQTGGHKVQGYKLNAKPLLYEYAQVTGQVLTVPIKLLNTKDVINSTPEVIIIREYLIRRIEVMKRNKNKSNNIKFISIFEEIEESTPTKKKAQKVRNIVKILLGVFKEKKYIKDFKFYKEGRAFKGVSIYY